MDVYVECSLCNCFVWEKECSLHIGYYDKIDFYICFECQPNNHSTS